MNYRKIYDSLIFHAKRRGFKKLDKNDYKYQYLETHHITPKSWNGGNEECNLVNLTAREHFIAHRLLLKISELEYGKTSKEYCAALSSLNLMSSENKGGIRITSRTYSAIRQKFSELQH